MTEKLNVRELLQGTEFADLSEVIATKIENAGYTEPGTVGNIAAHGKIAGKNPAVIVSVILEQYEKQRGRVEAVVIEPDPPTEPERKVFPEPDWLKATDSALALAEERGVDLSLVEGTGKSGTILKSDVTKFLEED